MDGYPYSRHLKTAFGIGGRALVDNGVILTNATRRITLPDDTPSFLKFSGDITNILIHIVEASSEGEYFVRIESQDPNIQLIMVKDTAVPFKRTELRSDHFERTVLVDDADTATYSIYAVNGPFYHPVLEEYPNFYVRYVMLMY